MVCSFCFISSMQLKKRCTTNDYFEKVMSALLWFFYLTETELLVVYLHAECSRDVFEACTDRILSPKSYFSGFSLKPKLIIQACATF